MKIDRDLYDEFLGCLGLTDGNARQQNLLRQIILNPYDSADAGFLSDGNSVWVIESLDEVNEANGFYRFR